MVIFYGWKTISKFLKLIKQQKRMDPYNSDIKAGQRKVNDTRVTYVAVQESKQIDSEQKYKV